MIFLHFLLKNALLQVKKCLYRRQKECNFTCISIKITTSVDSQEDSKMNKKIEIKIMARITLAANKIYRKLDTELYFNMEESTSSTDKRQFGRIRNGTKKISDFIRALRSGIVVVLVILLLLLPSSSAEYPTKLKNTIELISPII